MTENGQALSESYFANDNAIFDADIAALRLALRLRTNDDVRTQFLSFHHKASFSIRHSKIQMLEHIEPEHLCELVLRWKKLYEKYFVFLLSRHACQQGKLLTPEQAAETENLGLSKNGLSCISIASRYAEYWAEASVHEAVTFDQWQERLDYIGSDEFILLHDLRERGEILAYDRRGLALPVFDISRIVKANKNAYLWHAFASCNTHLVRLSETSARILSRLCGVDLNHPGEVRAVQGKYKGRATHNFLAVCFTSARAGIIGHGYVFLGGSPEIYILDDDVDIDSAFFIMQSLRSKSEFIRLVFHEDMVKVAWAVFPNQQACSIEDKHGAFMLTVLEAVNRIDGRHRLSTAYRYLDEWYFRGEDYSYR